MTSQFNALYFRDFVGMEACHFANFFNGHSLVEHFAGDGKGLLPCAFRTSLCHAGFFSFAVTFHLGIAHGVGDAISALTLNVAQTEWFSGGHSQEYWKRPFSIHNSSSRSKEYWANYCSMRVQNCYAALELLEKITPHMFKACEEIWEEAFGDE